MSAMEIAEDILIRDTFVLPVSAKKSYNLFGTTDADTWDKAGTGFDCYRNADLLLWEGPLPAFRPPAGFLATKQFWALTV